MTKIPATEHIHQGVIEEAQPPTYLPLGLHQSLKCGWCDAGTDVLSGFNFNLILSNYNENSHMWLAATTSAGQVNGAALDPRAHQSISGRFCLP